LVFTLLNSEVQEAWKLACEGTALLYRGDLQNARQLLQALGRRAEKGRTAMDIHDALEEAIGLLEAARPRAFGTGPVVDRDRLLQLLNHARATLPEEVLAAGSVLAQRNQIMTVAQEEADAMRTSAGAELEQSAAQAQARADEIMSAAQAEATALREAAERERIAMVDGHTVLLEAQARADDMLNRARHQAHAMRAEVDGYVDAKLAALAATLGKALDTVEHGRRKVRANGETVVDEAVSLR